MFFRRGKVVFGNVARVEARQTPTMEVIDKDFTAHFNGESWSISWQWKGEEPNNLRKNVSVYSEAKETQQNTKTDFYFNHNLMCIFRNCKHNSQRKKILDYL